MTNAPRYSKSTRIQTTISVLEEAVASLDTLAQASGVSRSRLMDLAVRRFLRWAANLDPQDLQLIAEYEVTEPISGFVRRNTPSPIQAVEVPPPPAAPSYHPPPQQAQEEDPRAKVLSSSAPAYPEAVVDVIRRDRRVPVEEAPRVRDRHGRYVSEVPPAPRGRRDR